jgi:hypothetical protein
MRKRAITILSLCSAYILISLTAGADTARPTAGGIPGSALVASNSVLEAATAFGNAPLYFIPNQGQKNGRALYYAKARAYTLWLTKQGLVFDSIKRIPGKAQNACERDVSRLIFKGASPSADLEAEGSTGYTVSYFYGRDADDWKTGLAASKGVIYRGVYSGIDLKIYGFEREVEYDWIVGPGRDPGKIRMEFQGVRATRIDSEGSLIVETPFGEIQHRRPSAYQTIGGRKVPVEARFHETADREYGFLVADYDKTQALVIDPYVLTYSTYLGGSQYDRITKIATDSSKAIYVSGQTESSDFPLAAGLTREVVVRKDAFVTKLSPDGRSLVYSAFFPANFCGFIRLAVDSAGSAYLAGSTDSRSFPVKNAFQEKTGGYIDGFIVKLKPSGRGIVYSSYIGGGNNDYANCIAVDAKGYAYVGGQTGSYDLPIKKAFQKTYEGYDDGFLLKVAPEGRSLVFATYFGGSLSDIPTGIGLGPDGAITIGGNSYSRDLPLKNPYQKTLKGSADFFLTQFAPDGQSLIFSTYLGGGSWDQLSSLAVDKTGQIVAVGFTNGNFPQKKPIQPARKGAREGVVAMLSADGRKLLFSTYLGGVGNDDCSDVAVDGAGSIYVVGTTYSRDFPRKIPYQKSLKGQIDAFLTILSPSGPSLVFSTFLGGIYHDWGLAVGLDSEGRIYLAGDTNSLDLPVEGPYQKGFGGGTDDGFISVFKAETGSTIRKAAQGR